MRNFICIFSLIMMSISMFADDAPDEEGMQACRRQNAIEIFEGASGLLATTKNIRGVLNGNIAIPLKKLNQLNWILSRAAVVVLEDQKVYDAVTLSDLQAAFARMPITDTGNRMPIVECIMRKEGASSGLIIYLISALKQSALRDQERLQATRLLLEMGRFDGYPLVCQMLNDKKVNPRLAMAYLGYFTPYDGNLVQSTGERINTKEVAEKLPEDLVKKSFFPSKKSLKQVPYHKKIAPISIDAMEEQNVIRDAIGMFKGAVKFNLDTWLPANALNVQKVLLRDIASLKGKIEENVYEELAVAAARVIVCNQEICNAVTAEVLQTAFARAKNFYCQLAIAKAIMRKEGATSGLIIYLISALNQSEPHVFSYERLEVVKLLLKIGQFDGYPLVCDTLINGKVSDKRIAVKLLGDFIPYEGCLVPATGERIDAKKKAQELPEDYKELFDAYMKERQKR